MTAEIAVMNRHAVALAADSAVTINYPGGQKIYNSVNKLFTLSRFAPVGVMVYGVANLTGVPWETIIKSYRRQLGEKTFPTVRDYAEDLIAFINDHKLMFTEKLQTQQVMASTLLQFRSVLREVDTRSQSLLKNKASVTERDIKTLITRSTSDILDHWKNASKLPGSPANHGQRIRSKWKSEIDVVIDLVFERLPVTKTARARLHELAGLIFTADLFPDNVSGVVVAGFGEAEYFPSLVAYDMEGVLLNFVKVRQNNSKSATVADAEAVIVPFAQGDMVSLFMEGIDPEFRGQIQQALARFVDGLPDILVNGLGFSGSAERLLRKQIDQAAKGLATDFLHQLGTHANERHINPIIEAVANLPKEELAEMADSLVNLTSFKRRVTKAPETVGGPVDVAVISKGDGFIWIRRKHYFDPKLNHQFFSNYYRT